ncbi:MAG: hypothetical protein DRP00_03900 [Candidatus Aenigmatarchaeota archaeon]|nr:MAG: hypothetical protein DRP00_03900 [Candidatus Aenigmarchaeota archaeon]
MDRKEIKNWIEGIKRDIEHLEKNRISKEMIERNRDIYETSETFRRMVKDQRQLEDETLETWSMEIERLKEMMK